VDTLESLMEALQETLEREGWRLSGLQKTTSWMFEGRWEGHQTRSAYLFFHRADLDDVSIDVFLDETSSGLQGNLALVIPGPTLATLADPADALARLADVSARTLPAGYRRPITLRYRLAAPDHDPALAATECRLKVHLPRSGLDAGRAVVQAVCRTAMRGFEAILSEVEPWGWGGTELDDGPSDDT
jgi:hypothetical protein